MAKNRKLLDPGFGNLSTKNSQRFVNKNGTFNIKHINNKSSIYSAYTFLVNISWFRFFTLVVLGYVIINTFFAILYLIIGIDNLHESTNSTFHDFLNAFFFSAQTITTVGYGGMSPTGVLAGVVSTLEALVGLLSFSFVTGLLYGRFAKPKSYIKFSDVILHRPFKEGKAIMFRMMNTKKSLMMHPKVVVTLALHRKLETGYQTNFFELLMERNQITYLPTTWTLVHEINKDSPLNEYTEAELKTLKGEFIISAQYFDESFNQEVYCVHSYTIDELIFNKGFIKAFQFNEEGMMVVDHDKLNETVPLNS